MARLDRTHDPQLRSWVASANGHPDFPIQNLPLGVFTPPGGARARGGVAIGDEILDLAAAAATGLFSGEGARAIEAASDDALNRFSPSAPARDGRCGRGSPNCWPRAPPRRRRWKERCTAPQAARCTCRPTSATTPISTSASTTRPTSARLFRPDNPLLPNYKYVPIGYHGRASSVRPSGTPVRRPNGQRKPPGEAEPSFGPSERLDYELELGVWIGPGNELGRPIPITEAAEHIAGFCLLNDWSARDIQAWEYQPLGPFLAKNFASTISPWVITPEALAPFRIPQPPRPEDDPAPLPYLLDETDQREGALDLELEVRAADSRVARAGSPCRTGSP